MNQIECHFCGTRALVPEAVAEKLKNTANVPVCSDCLEHEDVTAMKSSGAFDVYTTEGIRLGKDGKPAKLGEVTRATRSYGVGFSDGVMWAANHPDEMRDLFRFVSDISRHKEIFVKSLTMLVARAVDFYEKQGADPDNWGGHEHITLGGLPYSPIMEGESCVFRSYTKTMDVAATKNLEAQNKLFREGGVL